MANARWYDEDEEETKQEDQKTESLLDHFVGSMKKNQGTEAISEQKPEKVNVYPEKNGKITSGPPAQKEVVQPGGNRVRFYEDKTERENWTAQDKIAMALIALAGPVLGQHFGGKVGAYGGAAQSLGAVAGVLKDDEDRYNKARSEKLRNKSRIMTARELAAMGQKGGTGKVGTFQWVKGSNKKGEPVYYRVNRVTGDVDQTRTLPGYSKEYYDRVPQGNGAVADDDGAEMPPPDDVQAAAPAKSGKGASLTGPTETDFTPPPTNPKDDRTFDYKSEKGEPKPANVAGDLPKSTITEGGPGTRVSADEANASADILAEQQRDAIKAQMPQPIDLNPAPRNGESYDQAKQRAADARKLRDDLNGQLKDVNKNLLDFRQDNEKAQKGLEHSKALAKFKKSLDKNRVMKNGEGQLVDVDAIPGSTKVVDATKSPTKSKDTAPGGGKRLKPNEIERLTFAKTALKELDILEGEINKNKGIFGPFVGRAGEVNPYAKKAKDMESKTKNVAQTIGKYMEGGKLMKEDEIKYQKMLSNLKDTPDGAIIKLNNARDMLRRKHEAELETLRQQGYDVSGLEIGDFTQAVENNRDEQTSQVKDAHPGMVRFRAPNGQEAWIPKGRVDYYQQKAGGKGQVLGE